MARKASLIGAPLLIAGLVAVSAASSVASNSGFGGILWGAGDVNGERKLHVRGRIHARPEICNQHPEVCRRDSDLCEVDRRIELKKVRPIIWDQTVATGRSKRNGSFELSADNELGDYYLVVEEDWDEVADPTDPGNFFKIRCDGIEQKKLKHQFG